MAYLMMKRQMSFQQVVDFVVERRAVVCPNLGFLKQLQLFENMNFNLEGETQFHGQYN